MTSRSSKAAADANGGVANEGQAPGPRSLWGRGWEPGGV